MTFEEFLESKYDEIDNDSNNMNKEFEAHRDTWFEHLDSQELIDYAEEYGQQEYNRGVSDMHKEAKTSLDEVMNKGDWNGYLEKLTAVKGADENDILKEYKEKE